MTEPHTPGAMCYAAFWAADLPDFRGPAWATLPPGTQARWEAAALAVLAWKQEAPPRMEDTS